MSYSKKHKSIRQKLALVLSLVLTLTSLYTGQATAAENPDIGGADTATEAVSPGDAGSVQAESKAEAEPEGANAGISAYADQDLGTGKYSQGEWTASSIEAYTQQRTTVWDFTATSSSDTTLNAGDTINGITVVDKGTGTKLHKNGYLSAKMATLSLPLDSDTVAVSITYEASTNAKRTVTFGENAKLITMTESPQTVELTKEAGDFTTVLKMVTGTNETGDSGEAKANKITLVEYKNGEIPVEMIEFTRKYDFTDGSIIPNDKSFNGNTPKSSADKKLTIDCGTGGNGYGSNGDAHGAILKSGNTLTIAVQKGQGTISLGGCQYSGASVKVAFAVKGGEKIAEKNTKTEKCYHNDAAALVTFDYTAEADTEYVLTFDGSSTYVPCVIVSGTEPKPAVTDIKATVTLDADSLALLSGGKVILTNADDAAETHDVTAATQELTLKSNATYNLSTDNAKLAAAVDGKDSFTTKEADLAVAISVSSLVVNPTVELKAGSTLAAGKKIMLTYKEKETDTEEKSIDLTVGDPVELYIGRTYNIKTDDENAEARVGGKTSFVAAADMTALEVELLSKDLKVVMTVNGNLGSDKVIMTNTADETDKVEFGDGDTVTLKLNATYAVSCSNGEKFAKIEGKDTYTVADAITALTVDITAAEYHTYDVWDFGAEQLASTPYNTYNNQMTADQINALYPGVTPGSTGKNIASFTMGDMSFNDGGYPTTHRWRSCNGELTRYDGTPGGTDRIRKDPDGNVYQGYIYSNKGSTNTVYLSFKAKAGDIFTLLVGSNSNAATYTWAYDDGTDTGAVEATAEYGKSANVEPVTFYASKDGTYRLYTMDEKLVVARVYRERPVDVTVSGTVSGPALPAGAAVVFTQLKEDGTELRSIEAPITNGSYSVTLQEMYDYKISLANANGFIVDTNATADNGVLSLGNRPGNQTLPVTVVSVDLVNVSGSLADLTAADAAKLKLTFGLPAGKVYVPEFSVNADANTFKAVLEKDVVYTLSAEDVDDYTLDTASVSAGADNATVDIKFTKKPVYDIAVTLQGPTAAEAANVKLTFVRLKDGTVEPDGYTYEFTGTSGVKLRDGKYQITAVLEGYAQQPTVDLIVSGAAASATIPMKSTAVVEVPYKDTITVGAAGCDYTTINGALEAVRNMNRTGDQRVTISIQPGDYEEMLVVDVANVTLKNASASPSIELTDKGVGIADGAVRVTSYYGHGYSYYSMGEDYKWNADVLAANKANGYKSVTNPGSGSATMWNATVEIKADGFQAEGIIFENSFNQYMSKKASEDTIVKEAGAKEGSSGTRSSLPAGSTAVQQKAYVERAAALAIGNNISDVVFNNCKFIGRQDTLYGGTNTYVEFNGCSIYGACDFIFGGMVAIFDKCDLVMNTTDDKNDVAYITAPQQKSGRGYLMNECHITSVRADVDVDSAYFTHNTSKPGYFGRPWQGGTSEVVYFNTTIDAADPYWETAAEISEELHGKSLIAAVGWNSGLGGTSPYMYEYGTKESAGVDNSASRADWAKVLTDTKLADGVYISKDAFRKGASQAGLYVIDLSKGLKAGVNYDGGITVMEDMPMKSDGYVQGANNPKDENGKGAKGTIPASGSVLVLNAQQNGRLKVDLKGTGGKTVYFLDVTDAGTNETQFVPADRTTKVFKVEAGHTYYLYGDGTKICMYNLIVDYRPAVDWSTVSAPVLGVPVATQPGDADEGMITIPFAAQVGGVYSDQMDLGVYLNGELIDTVTTVEETDPLKAFEGMMTYKPEKSGTYTFKAFLKRDGEASKESNVSPEVTFVLPMATPVIVNAENQGGGNVKFSWQEVPEAALYEVYMNGEKVAETTELFHRFTGLEVGKEYTFGVLAVGNNDKSEMAETKLTVTQGSVKTWQYAAFGSGVDKGKGNNEYSNATFDDNGNLTGVTVQSMNGKGKIVPASTDGLAYYYTVVDPETENFTLEADIKVDEWKYSNGQEGFGMMVADRVGVDGDSTDFWNNSYMASVTKVEYYWNLDQNGVGDSGQKFTMRLGVGSQEKIGVTPENLAAPVDDFLTKMTTLETSAAQEWVKRRENNVAEADAWLAANPNFNVAKNCTNVTGYTELNPQETFHLKIQRNNTGYLVSYTDPNGVTTTNKYYHGDDGDELCKLDKNNIYVGFFASRNAKITVSNVKYSSINPKDDAPAEARPITYVTPNYSVESGKTANRPDYELVFYSNADGTLKLTKEDGTLIATPRITAEEKFRQSLTLEVGSNDYVLEFTPDPDFCPSKYERLTTYEMQRIDFSVNFRWNDKTVVYAGPASEEKEPPFGDGTREDPYDIYNAIAQAQPGQTIYLLEGTYKLDKTVTIDRGVNGNPGQPIRLMKDPQAKTRPVLDFQGICAGMVLAGDYWYFNGFDVTNSAKSQKGIQVSGDHNTLEGIYAYRNGNTGIQISRYKGTDEWEDWPSNNLILNCTSYLNADPGYEDADGFAAKLTIADGNVFDGCIAAYNADDGWDLFAKVESGPIGKVIIRNCLAFKNGYDLDANGNEIVAGNGNGFKMGGSSIPGEHELHNSIAFANRAKGIDSNSGPNIKVYGCTSFNNESYNVAFYTNTGDNTDYAADGILSYKNNGNTEAENIKLRGAQLLDNSAVYGVTNFYYDGSKSTNTAKKQVAENWFVHTDVNAAITPEGGFFAWLGRALTGGQKPISRYADGSINMNGFLELTAAAKAEVADNVGARFAEGTDVQSTVVTTPEELVLTDDLKNLGYTSVEEVENRMLSEIKALAQAKWGGAYGDEKQVQVYEVVLTRTYTDGRTEPVTADNFPTGGVDVRLPIPENIGDVDEYEFAVAHMVVWDLRNRIPNAPAPGTVENCKILAKTNDYIEVHVMSASPFAITWNAIPEDDDSDADGGSGGAAGAGGAAEAAGKKSPKTDANGNALWNGLNALITGTTLDDYNGGQNAQDTQDEQQNAGADELTPVTAAASVDNRISTPWVAVVVLALALVGGISTYVVYRKKEQE